MPGKDGFTFIHDLPHKDKNPGIVFVTAYDQYAIQAIKNHAFDYLLKPVNRKELKDCVVNFMSVEPAEKHAGQYAYADLNSDSISETVHSAKGVPLFFIAVQDNHLRFYDQWNLSDSKDTSCLPQVLQNTYYRSSDLDLSFLQLYFP